MAMAKKKSSKPTVFFSHSSRDAVALKRLKDAFLAKTGGSIEVFLSSDGQSIQLGANWVHRVEQGLDDSNLMFVFVSPASLRSHWLFFEAGYAYSRDLRVIPIGINGIDLTVLPPPLSLLQGRNLTSADGLNNLIAEVNRAFQFTHAESFVAQDFSSIFGSAATDTTIGEYVGLIESVTFLTPDMERAAYSNQDDRYQAYQLYKAAAEALVRHGVHYAVEEHSSDIRGLETYGASVRMMREDRVMIVSIDPLAIEAGLDICKKLAADLPEVKTIEHCNIVYSFKRGVTHLSGPEKVSARMDPDKFKLRGSNSFAYKNLQFHIGYPDRKDPISQIDFTLGDNSVDLQSINEVVAYLFERDILQYSPRASKRDQAESSDDDF